MRRNAVLRRLSLRDKADGELLDGCGDEARKKH
jgi:hypothetical protein